MRLPYNFARQSGSSPAERSDMKRLSLLIAFLFVSACGGLFAQGKIDLQTSDTIISILQKNVGQVVELWMKSGEKIGGKLEKVGDKLVHLSQLTGAEFFDAAVDTADVAAVVVRTKK
jgi:LPS binding domain of CAP18 (C terminal)